uniref:Olfactory receptor n=1 Tax=Lepisosteus oculatus TaxID=7918 RepID=W5NLR2_LEPOC
GTMSNSSSSYYGTLIFTSYGSLGNLRYLYITFALLTYVLTVFANVFLMLVIYLESSLHKPMYIFLFNLALNGLYGSSAFYPKLMDHLLSDVQGSSYVGCLVQVFCISTYGTCAYAILTVMAYDRYISICKPLQYYNIMTPAKVRKLLAFSYFFPISGISVHVWLTSRLPLCRFTIHKLFCHNLAVVNLSCADTRLNNAFGLLLTTGLVVLPFILVVLSYQRILIVSVKASKEAQRKAWSTCAPHLITFANFSMATLFSVIYNRLELYVPTYVNLMMSLHIVVIPPLLHPVIYGLRTQEIRKSILKMLSTRRLFTV